MASEWKCTPAQLALAWVLAQGQDIVPIPGTKRIPYLEENAQTLSVRLTSEQLERLNKVFPPGVAAGERYPESAMKNVNR
jgi:aryl-alcohol dehydrogenase-like predicted oxidoreductase